MARATALCAMPWVGRCVAPVCAVARHGILLKGCALALCVALALPAFAECRFDNLGTITNPQDPSCRDARFELTANDSGNGRIALGYPPPLPIDSLTGIDGFRSYASLHARHQALLIQSATVAGSVVGHTLEGRAVWAYRVGDADTLTSDGVPEAAVLINGGIHAREWQSPEALTEIFETLTEIADDDGFGRYLADAVNVVLVPVLNIDGLLQTQRFPTQVSATALQPRDGRLRRKNMRTPAGGAPVDDSLDTGEDQFFGVDLNRNSAHGFGVNNRSSSDPVSQVYRGTAVASEPETQALLAAAALAPVARLRMYIDAHSFSQVYFVPRTGDLRRDTLTLELVNRMRAVLANKYDVSASSIGSYIGSSADFFAREFDIPAWTLEIEPRSGGQDYGGTGASHSGFVLPDREVARMRDEVTSMTLLGAFHQAGPPALVAVQIDRASDGTTKLRADWTLTASGRRELNTSIDDGLVGGERYRLWLAFDKPMRFSADGVTVSDYPGQSATRLPTLSLDAGGSNDALQIVLGGAALRWIAAPGGAPDGYRRYRFDALTTTFDAPATDGVLPLALSVAATDLAGLALDANPATPVDWQDGHWSDYEDEFGDAGDSGGSDCTLQTALLPAAGATRPAVAQPVVCKAAFVTAATPLPSLPPPAPRSSGGGGAPAAPVLLLLALLVIRARTASRTG